MNSLLLRFAAPLGLGLAVLLGPLQSVIWNGTSAPSWAQSVARTLEPSLSFEVASSSLAVPPAVYFSHGRLFILVYLLLLVGVAGASLTLDRWTSRALLLCLGVATIADLLAYWVSESAGPALRAVAFWRIEVPALAIVLVVATIHGLRRFRASPTGWAFALALPVGLLATWALHYMPHGPVIGLAFALAIEGLVRPRGVALSGSQVMS